PDWPPLSPNGRLVDPAPISSASAGGWVAGGDWFARPAPSFDPADRSQSNPIQSNPINLSYSSSPAAVRRLRFARTPHPVGWILESFPRSFLPSVSIWDLQFIGCPAVSSSAPFDFT
uniref:Uncharacterized protein n=1 Tax=Triticum urartu TaxID=4572 RepID=A0A8R7P414_TRIUA